MHSPGTANRKTALLVFVRRCLLAILMAGVLGTFTELLLLEHFEQRWQWTPLILLGLTLLLIATLTLFPRRSVLRLFQSAMLFVTLSGFVGIGLHYRGNVEFEKELAPSISGWALFRESITGAFPALAPGTMIELGLIGLVYAHLHPSRNMDS